MSANPDPLEPAQAAVLQESTSQRPKTQRVPLSKARLFWVLRTLGWCLLLGLGLGLMLQQTVTAGQKATDFCQDYLAARNVLQGMPPYSPLLASPNAQLCLPPLNYDSHPPFSVLLVLPLGLLPRAAASLVWSLLVLACYLTTGALLLKALGWWTVRGAALFVVGSLFWNPFGGSLDAQNYSELLMLLVLGSWLLDRKGHAGWAGVALGLAALLKVWPLALFCIVLARRRYRLALVGGLVALVGTVVTLAAFGFQTYATYLGPVLHQEAADIPHEVNVSLVAAIARPWTGFHDPSVIDFPPLLPGLSISQAALLGEGIAALVVLGTLALVVWGLRRKQGEAMEWVCQGLLVTVLLLAFPITWNWGVISLLLPLGTTALALRSLPRPPRWWFILLGCSLAFLVNPEWLPFYIARQYPLASSVIFGLPTLALLLFALAQAQLLLWAGIPPKERAMRKSRPNLARV